MKNNFNHWIAIVLALFVVTSGSSQGGVYGWSLVIFGAVIIVYEMVLFLKRG